ncbi:BnaA05g29000D [Brassica napus]|uniref:BnaA05g29000D protein n=1 Tax=Brassica napus TaxID=3708 RepID=A0A078I490_BRANA|nr:BnaA05g29000D [Brassica napus]
MGNGASGCCVAGDTSRRCGVERFHDNLGHSFSYVRPVLDGSRPSFTQEPSLQPDPIPGTTTTFRSISGASVSANNSTSLSDSLSTDSSLKASGFESSNKFASFPLKPVPRGPTKKPSHVSGPFERRFLSGPIETGLVKKKKKTKSFSKPKPNKRLATFKTIFTNLISNNQSRSKKGLIEPINSFNSSTSDHHRPEINNSSTSTTLSSQESPRTKEREDSEEEEEEGKSECSLEEPKIQWAEGKAGEDRVHVILSEENGWLFVGIYDGFNGPDPPDYLLNNLYTAVLKELKGLLWDDENNSDDIASCSEDESDSEMINHKDVLKALEQALMKTEEAFDQTVDENPVLALMGSCVLVTLMKGEDVYVMSVGDSRAVLAQRSYLGRKKVANDLQRIKEEGGPLKTCLVREKRVSLLVPVQLTMEHSTNVQEEVRRIRNEHSDDPLAIENGRVKGYLKVTRAFGAGFLKQPKWNKAVLEMFRINYVGTSPYITCSPSLHHHRLTPHDKFLILSSDGLYEYFSSEEVIFEVESFISAFPEGDPAQHLIQEVLLRAAKKYGMDFHELLEIPQGDRRKYHDDVSVIVISLEGRIWKSSM